MKPTNKKSIDYQKQKLIEKIKDSQIKNEDFFKVIDYMLELYKPKNDDNLTKSEKV